MPPEDAELRDLLAWFQSMRPTLPSVPYKLREGTLIHDPERFYSYLEQQIECRGSDESYISQAVKAHLERVRAFAERLAQRRARMQTPSERRE